MIKDYFFDNVFHMTDDERELKADLMVVSSYLKSMNMQSSNDGIRLIKRINNKKNND